MTLSVELSIEDPAWAAVADLENLAEHTLAVALGESGKAVERAAEVSCLFCDDATIRALNAQWRGQDKPTNVLSFPAGTPAAADAIRLLGDIVLGFETVEREAREEGRPLDAHVAHLLVHGLLHLLGHDHAEPREAEAMEALETRIMRKLGRADPYADRPEAGAP
ncbi:MAG TPA: rRNA maturation RNase YbeY [Lichenihabitans sp.]|jgi:probable rRNA maturation factor|nr:rRNA maturation RNase YbeY [Lichenihabitans sp.]